MRLGMWLRGLRGIQVKAELMMFTTKRQKIQRFYLTKMNEVDQILTPKTNNPGLHAQFENKDQRKGKVYCFLHYSSKMF